MRGLGRLLCCGTGLLLAACTPSMVLGKRYGSADWTWQEPGSDPYVDLSIQAHVIEEPAPPTVLESVPGAAQESLLKLLGQEAQDAYQLVDSLSRSNPVQASDVIDRTTFRRNLVFSVQKRLLDRSADGRPLVGPADRLSRLQITLVLQSGEFLRWSSYDSQYGTRDLGSVSLTQERGAGAAAVGSSPTIPIQEAHGSVSTGLSETAFLQRQYEALTPILEPGQVTLFREGIVGLDLSGNLSLEVEVRWNGDWDYKELIRIDNLRHGGRPTAPDKLHVRRVALHYAQGLDDIRGAGVARYEVRSVLAGDETLSEHDDQVRFLVGEDRADTVLVRAQELEVRRFAVRLGEDPLYLTGFGLLEFATYDEARAFLDWVLETDWTDRDLVVGPYPVEDLTEDRVLTVEDLRRLRIHGESLNSPTVEASTTEAW